MNSKDKKIGLHFDRFQFYASPAAIQNFIRKELQRLSKATGYSIDNIPIEFDTRHKGQTIAFFEHAGPNPIRFNFNMKVLEGFSPNKILDTTQHEFAHFLVLKKYGHGVVEAHGKEWQAICKELGALPSPYADLSMTQHIATADNIKF